MKNFAASSAMLLCSLAPATAEPPFFPFPDVVDHVVTMTVNPGWGAGSDNGKIITHRGGRTRVDLTENGRSWASYFDRTDSKSVTVLRQSSGEYLSVVIRRGFEHHKGFDYRSFDTGERQVVLGESCSVWNVMRSTDFIELTKLSCVTDDGIELWFKVIGRLGIVRSGDATRIERRTVQPNEVSPPADLSLPKSWVERTEPVATVAPADFEVVMETADTPKTTRTTRRHYPWTYTEDPQRGGRRTVSIVNDATGLKMHFESNASGDVKALTIIPPLGPITEAQMARAMAPDFQEIVLGEECMWFDMWQGEDAGLLQCRTRDGIVLKEQQRTIGTVVTFAAVRLQRRAVGLAEVLPRTDVLMGESAGIRE